MYCLLQQVNAYRSMLHNDMMVGAFSHSTAVGKLRQELPDVPSDARLIFPRYTVDEAETVCHYYMRYFQIKICLVIAFEYRAIAGNCMCLQKLYLRDLWLLKCFVN